MCLQFGFLIIWRKDFGAKAAHKMLVKLTPGYQTLLYDNLVGGVKIHHVFPGFSALRKKIKPNTVRQKKNCQRVLLSGGALLSGGTLLIT
jgi:hypothetical protein